MIKVSENKQMSIDSKNIPLLRLCLLCDYPKKPCIFSNICENDFMYKSYPDVNDLVFVIPKNNEHFVYDSEFCHYIPYTHLIINIWKKNNNLKNNLSYSSNKLYTNDIDKKWKIHKSKINFEEIHVNEDIEKILYSNNPAISNSLVVNKKVKITNVSKDSKSVYFRLSDIKTDGFIKHIE